MIGSFGLQSRIVRENAYIYFGFKKKNLMPDSIFGDL